MRRPLQLALVTALGLGTVVGAAVDPPRDATGQPGLVLMLRKLATVGTVMLATAHPDDEHNALISRLTHGEGFRVVIATATRGSGGQNEIGPELFHALGVLRTEELLAARRFDGAEQLFGAAVDFGYSFSIEETYEKWGREETVGDFVRLIRHTRPDVIVTMRPTGGGGGQHHQASARLAAEAFTAAGSGAGSAAEPEFGPARPWRAARLFQISRYGFGGEPEPSPDARAAIVETDVYDPVLGHTYAEIGSQARAMHKSQGFGQLLSLPGSFAVTLARVDEDAPARAGEPRRSLHDGLDLSLEGLAGRFAGAAPPPALVPGLRAIADPVRAAGAGRAAGGPDAALDALLAGLRATRELRSRLSSIGLDAQPLFELDFRLHQTEAKFASAVALAHGLRLEALADDGVVTPGQDMHVAVIAANRGARPLEWRHVVFDGLRSASSDCRPGPLAAGTFARCQAAVRVPADAPVTAPYWHRDGDRGRHRLETDAPFGLPFRPTPFAARLSFVSGGVPVDVALPVQYRYEGNIFSGEKRMELHVVPAFSVRVRPEIAIVPAQGGGVAQDVRVTVTSSGPGAATGTVRLVGPDGWAVEPASQPVTFSRADEAVTVRFGLEPAAGAGTGTYEVTATVEANGRTYGDGFEVIEYPHTPRRHRFQPAATRVHVIDVSVPEGLKVGYVMGVGDQVPPAIEQIGASLTMLGAEDLAWGDLSRFDAIVTGVRAYERRADLRAFNHRLLQYAERGGTVIVQYNKFEFNQAQYGPYPVKVSSTRVTDENSPVTVLQPEHPLFVHPNPITSAAWRGWAQERGLYFLGERDPRYVDLIELVEPFELNAGPKRGALVEARTGRGRWIYVGLGLWRQLPAGTEGAYHLLANLISLGRTAPVTEPHARR